MPHVQLSAKSMYKSTVKIDAELDDSEAAATIPYAVEDTIVSTIQAYSGGVEGGGGDGCGGNGAGMVA